MRASIEITPEMVEAAALALYENGVGVPDNSYPVYTGEQEVPAVEALVAALTVAGFDVRTHQAVVRAEQSLFRKRSRAAA